MAAPPECEEVGRGFKEGVGEDLQDDEQPNDTRKMENRSKQPNQDSLTWLTSSSN
jgi:hypothetical protein